MGKVLECRKNGHKAFGASLIIERPWYSIHGKNMGKERWCPTCQGWVDYMTSTTKAK